MGQYLSTATPIYNYREHFSVCEPKTRAFTQSIDKAKSNIAQLFEKLLHIFVYNTFHKLAKTNVIHVHIYLCVCVY